MPAHSAPYCYDYPRPALTVDAVVVRQTGVSSHTHLEILLIQRGKPPFAGHWALPGGFVDRGESPVEAVRRELYEETGISADSITQIGAFGEPGRDPRGWVVSIAFLVSLEGSGDYAVAGDDAARAEWWSIESLPALAFDHAQIVAQALPMVTQGAS